MVADQARNFRGSFSGYERKRLFYNAHGRLVQSAYVLGLDTDEDGRAVAAVDIDGDGDLDMVLLTAQGLRLFENTSDPRHFSRVRLTAVRSQANALGATVELRAGGITRRGPSLGIKRALATPAAAAIPPASGKKATPVLSGL